MDEYDISVRPELGSSKSTGIKRKAADFFDNEDDAVETINNHASSNAEIEVQPRKSMYPEVTSHDKNSMNYLENMKQRVKSTLQRNIPEVLVTTSSSILKKSQPQPAISDNLREAIEDENVYSIQSVYKASLSTSSQPDDMIEKIPITSYSSSKTFQPSAPASKSNDKNLPIYKVIKNGDMIMAKYASDEKYYPATVLKVIHKGYPNATYDIKFQDYDNIESVSWKDVYINETLAQPLSLSAAPAQGNAIKSSTDIHNDIVIDKDIFGRDLPKQTEVNANAIQVHINVTESNITWIQRILHPPPKPFSVLKNFKDEDYINMDTYNRLRNTRKQI